MVKNATLYFYLFLIAVMPYIGSVNAKVNHVVLDQLSVNDGLSQASISVIMQDDAGFVWLGNESGVNIYDGYTVRTLSGPEGKFHKYSVSSIRKGRDGKIWMSFWSDGLYSYDPKTGIYEFILDIDPENAESPTVSMFEDPNNNTIWIITEKTLLNYQPQTRSIIKRIDLSDELDIKWAYIHGAMLIEDKVLIATRIGTYVYSLELNQLFKLPDIDAQSFTNADITQKEVNKIYQIRHQNGQIILGTNDGVFGFPLSEIAAPSLAKGSDINYELYVPEVAVWDFSISQDKLYIGATSGLHELDLLSREYRKLLAYSDFDPTVAKSDVLSVFVDQRGLVWLGSGSAGAFIWDPTTELLQNFRYNKLSTASLSGSSVTSMLQSPDNPNTLYVGTDVGLNLVDIESNQVKTLLKVEDSKTTETMANIYKLAEGSEGQIWLETAIGMSLLDTNDLNTIPFTYTPEVNEWLANLYATTLFHKGMLWAATDEGFYRFNTNTGNRVQIKNLPNTIKLEHMYNIMPSPSDNDHEVFISTNDSLWLFNAKNGTFKKLYTHPDITSANYTYFDSWQVDEDNRLWLALVGVGVIGLSRENYQIEHFYNAENAGINHNVYGLQLDGDNNLWFSSHAGLYRLDLTTKHIRNYGLSDGLASKEFNSGANIKLANGDMAYGGVSGLSIFNPKVIGNTSDYHQNEVSIVNVSTLSRNLNTPLHLDENSPINLEYDDVGIRIDFSNFVFGNKSKPLYEYGFLGGTKYPEAKQNYAVFSELEPGKHILEVRAKSPITGEYSATKTIVLDVSYAPWNSPMAISFYVILVVLFFLYWQHGRYLRQRELLDAHQQVKYRENRLQLALSGSNSEVWDWKARNNQIFGKRLVTDLGYHEEDLTHSFQEHIDFIHPEDRASFLSCWQLFINSGDRDKSFECSYRLRSVDGSWFWYKDLGKIVALNEDGLPTRVTGSYTNITESKANIERAQYYGAAFEQTKDWVVIVDEKFTKVRVNKSMAQVFGFSEVELEFSRDILGLSEERVQFYAKLLPKIRAKGHWRGEELISTPRGEQYHVIINISISLGEQLGQTHYICVLTDITAQKSAEKELRYMANYDHLTGLPNRTLLLDRIGHAIEYSARQEHSIALFFIDLDRFKQVNDSLGHDYGDLLLKEVTQRLMNTLRVDDTIARIGGDEFVVLLESYKNNNELSYIAQKIIDVVEQPVSLGNNVVSVGTSIGISLFPEDSNNSDELLRNADVAMYHAKQQGRNNYQFFTEHMNEEAKQRLGKESNLKLAVSKDEFFNLYQPIVNAHTGKAVGAELLMRWEHMGNIVSPVDFIPLAEELGLILLMTDMAMEKGFSELIKWREYRDDFYLSVNFSAGHFANDELVPSIERILAKHQLPANALKIEVTENAFISDPERAILTMNKLKALGVRLSLDDFGTGFSSLSYLKRLPLDIIKIDRSFVSGIGVEKTDEAIVDATLVLAKSLNMYCVAEGVETKAQLQYLADRQCYFIQGYLYYKPLLPDELFQYIKENSNEITAVSANVDLITKKIIEH